jgi:thiol-disulfide isomerase/thioredoxin
MASLCYPTLYNFIVPHTFQVFPLTFHCNIICMRLPVLIVCLLITASAFAQGKRTVIVPAFQTTESGYIQLIYPREVATLPPTRLSRSAEKIVLELETPICVNAGNSGQILYRIYPGDSLLLKNDTNDVPLLIAPADPNRSKEFIATKALFEKSDPGFFTPAIPMARTVYSKQDSLIFKKYNWRYNPRSYEERNQIIEDQYRKRLQLMEELRQQYQLSPEYTNFYTHHCLHFYHLQKIMGVFPPNSGKMITSIPEKFRRELPDFLPFFSDSAWLVSPAFCNGLIVLNKALAGRTPDWDATPETIYASALEHFTGPLKDYLLFALLSRINTFKTTVDTYKDLVSRFMNDCQNEQYKQTINAQFTFQQQALNINNGRSIYAATLLDGNNRQLSFNDIMGQHKENIVYVDFWASWCGPCLAAMPSSKKLQRELKDKAVHFIYISLDTDKNAWEKSSASLGLAKENSFILLSPFTSPLSKMFNAHQTIPQYGIFDKTGKLYTTKAPRPGDAGIKKLLLKLAK